MGKPSKGASIISWIGILLLAIGLIFMPSTIITQLEAVKFYKLNPYGTILIPGSPSYFAFPLGLILAFVGGLISKERSLWLPLIISGGLTNIASVCLFVIPALSPYADGFHTGNLIRLIFFTFPGEILILQGVWIRFRKPKIKKA
jgi:hypothetical protein